jgi:hypothetical protein
MKIKFIESIKIRIDTAIDMYKEGDIEHVLLDQWEYIQFLEEITITDKVVMTLPDRRYRGVKIKVNTV